MRDPGASGGMAFLSRRQALLGGLALAASAGAQARAAEGTREFVLYRAGAQIGNQTLRVARNGDTVDVEIRIRIEVSLVGLPVYRYSLDARERWNNGALILLDATTDDNGTAHFARASREAGVLQVRGSAFSGPVDGMPATTSYWSPAFLERQVWISTQDGRPFDVSASPAGAVAFPAASGSIRATRWNIAGALSGLALFYDAAGEWVGTEFPARGETARFVVARRGPALAPLWVPA